MAKPTYQIKDWDKHFENHESRKLKRTAWVSLPNRHDGKSFRRIAAHSEGVEIFAAWTLILEVASKMPTRGILADEDGPLDSEDLASMTGFPATIFDSAFKLLTQEKIGWLTNGKRRGHLPKSPATSRNLPESPGVTGEIAAVWKGTEGNGTEQKRIEDSAKAGASAIGKSNSGTQEFTLWKLAVGKLMGAGMEEQSARKFIGEQCRVYGKPAVAQAVTEMLAQEPAEPKGYIVKLLQAAGKDNKRQTASDRNVTNIKDSLAYLNSLDDEPSQLTS